MPRSTPARLYNTSCGRTARFRRPREGATGISENTFGGARARSVLVARHRPGEFSLDHFSRRVSLSEVMSFRELYPPLEPGELLRGTRDTRFAHAWELVSPTPFRPHKGTDLAVLRQA